MPLLEFQAHKTIDKPGSFIDTSGILAVLLFIFGLSLLGSRFVFSPGIKIDLPRSENIDLTATTGVLNIGLNGIVMFDNRMLKIDGLYPVIEDFFAHKKNPTAVTLLICVDQWVPFSSVATVIDILKKSGCQRVQIACEKITDRSF